MYPTRKLFKHSISMFKVKPWRAFIVMLFSVALFAQDAGTGADQMSDLSLGDLFNIKLTTGSFLELDLRSSPLTMTIITNNDIDQSGAANLSEILEIYVPGFQYMINKWNGDIWGMRGVVGDRNDKIIVLINGRKQNMQAFHGFATEYSLGLLGDIQRIEVLRGPAGLTYGSGAIGGVVNIVTRQAGEDEKSRVSVKALGKGGNIYGGSVEGSVFGESKNGQKIAAHAGFMKSEGLGKNTAKVYGHYEMNGDDWEGENGRFTAGSPGETPGNFMLSADYSFKGFRAYARATRQEQPLASYYYPAPFDGSEDSGTSAWINDQEFIYQGTNNYHAGWLPHPRTHRRDNITLDMSYTQEVGGDKIVADLAIIGNTNKLINAEDVNREEGLVYTNGEKRFELGAKYLLQRLEKLQAAVGFQYGYYHLGDDLQGNNLFWSGDRPWITDVKYNNIALFGEVYHNVVDIFSYELGIRFDKHTRTDGVVSPKGALILTPNDKHTFKFIIQSASNNADVLAYEFSAPADVDEKPWTYEHGAQLSQAEGNALLASGGVDSLIAHLGNLEAPASLSSKHSLKPEKSFSFELSDNHNLTDAFSAAYSVSYNKLSELFLWNSIYQQTVNLGEYSALNIELELKFKNDIISAGLNHVLQKPVNFSNDATVFTRTGFTPEWSTTESKWVPVATSEVVSDTSDILGPQISGDGKFFNSLNFMTTKLYLDFTPVKFISLHADARVFWGLKGREEKVTKEVNNGNDYISTILDGSGISDGHAPMTKLNTSIHFNLPSDWKIGVYGNNLLGSMDNVHSVRWHQMSAYSQGGYYTVDQRSYALKLIKEF